MGDEREAGTCAVDIGGVSSTVALPRAGVDASELAGEEVAPVTLDDARDSRGDVADLAPAAYGACMLKEADGVP